MQAFVEQELLLQLELFFREDSAEYLEIFKLCDRGKTVISAGQVVDQVKLCAYP